MGVRYKGLTEFNNKLNKALGKAERQKFFRSATREMQDILHSKVNQATPVGQYPEGSGRVGGTLRRGWQSEPIIEQGNTYKGVVSNDVEYAIYVEYGHRTRGGNGWVEGQFFTTLTVEALQPVIPALLNRMIDNWLGGIF